MSSVPENKKVVILGPLPPPFMGPTLATAVILDSALKDEFELLHLDTSDHRSTDTLGNIDFWNVVLPVGHYFKLLFVLLTKWPDLVYIPISQTTLGYLKDSVFILISKLFRRKVLCHLRGGNFRRWLDNSSGITKWYVRTVQSRVDGQIVLGNNLRALFEGLVPKHKLHVVYNGKDIDTSIACKPKEKRVVLFLSNLRRAKGVLDVLYCVPKVVSRFPDVEFYFAGSWPEPDVKQEFYTVLEEHPELPVKYLGVLTGKDKSEAFAASDIFVLPSSSEGQPWSIVEAMAFGLPVISTDQGSIKELVINNENGFVVDITSHVPLERSLCRLLGDEGRCKSMGEASRKFYEEKLTERSMVESLGAAMKSVLSS